MQNINQDQNNSVLNLDSEKVNCDTSIKPHVNTDTAETHRHDETHRQDATHSHGETHSHDETHRHGETNSHSHNHNHELFSDVYSKKECQLNGAPLDVYDIEKVVEAKLQLIQNQNFDNLINLGNALCFQLRYREAIEFYEKAKEKDCENILARRKLALCFLKTGNIDGALEEYSFCDQVTPNSLDIIYRIGLAHYYAGNYEKAKSELYRCFELSRDNGEMYIAVIYWYILSCVKLKQDLKFVLDLYNEKIECGHHIGYELTAKLFCGLVGEEKLYKLAKENDEMTFVIYLYGLYCYYQMKNDVAKAIKCKAELLKTDKYWACFSYLGAFYDFERENVE